MLPVTSIPLSLHTFTISFTSAAVLKNMLPVTSIPFSLHTSTISFISAAVLLNTFPVTSIPFSWHTFTISFISAAVLLNTLPTTSIPFSLHTSTISFISAAVLLNTLPVTSIPFSLHTCSIFFISSTSFLEFAALNLFSFVNLGHFSSISCILSTGTLKIELICSIYFFPYLFSADTYSYVFFNCSGSVLKICKHVSTSLVFIFFSFKNFQFSFIASIFKYNILGHFSILFGVTFKVSLKKSST